jgi:hypothetical protein
MTWSCDDFEGWLDDGRPNGREPDAAAHAASCDRCAAALAATLSIESALARPVSTAAPAGFTDAVMRRVGAASNARTSLAPAGLFGRSRRAGRMIVWLGLVTEPWVALSCALVALLSWRGSTILSATVRLALRLALWVEAAGRALGTVTAGLSSGLHSLSAPGATLGLGMATTAVLLLASWQLARWSEHLTVVGLSGSLSVRPPGRLAQR